MPTPTKGPRLGGGPAHERLMLANLATQLFEHRSITTTEAKAKRLRPLAERLITFAKRGDLAARRRVLTVVRDKSVVHFLFTEIAPAMAERQGGYTRIVKIGPRKGDNAPMAVISLVMEPVERKRTVAEAEAATRRAASDRATAGTAPAATEADTAEAGTVEAGTAEAGTAEAGTVEAGTAEAGTVADEAPVAVEATEGATQADATADAAEAPYGEGSAAPLADGSAPEGFTIKGNTDSMKFHTSASRWYEQTVAEAWFSTEEAAEAAGFTKAG